MIHKENLILSSTTPVYRIPISHKSRDFAYSIQFLNKKDEWTRENDIIKDIAGIQREAQSIHLDHTPFSPEALRSGTILAANIYNLHQADLTENPNLINLAANGLTYTISILASKPNLITEAFRVSHVIKALQIDHRASIIATYLTNQII